MPPKASVDSYVVNRPFDRVDPITKENRRYECLEPYDGDDIEQYLEWQLIVPAPAGSSQPGNDGSK